MTTPVMTYVLLLSYSGRCSCGTPAGLSAVRDAAVRAPRHPLEWMPGGTSTRPVDRPSGRPHDTPRPCHHGRAAVGSALEIRRTAWHRSLPSRGISGAGPGRALGPLYGSKRELCTRCVATQLGEPRAASVSEPHSGPAAQSAARDTGNQPRGSAGISRGGAPLAGYPLEGVDHLAPDGLRLLRDRRAAEPSGRTGAFLPDEIHFDGDT
jgi:hypothetical protein